MALRVFNNIGAALTYAQGQRHSSSIKFRVFGTLKPDAKKYPTDTVTILPDGSEKVQAFRYIGAGVKGSDFNVNAAKFRQERIAELFEPGQKYIAVETS